MPSLETLLPFALGLLVLQMTPGPDMLLILDRGMVHGTRSALVATFGIVAVAGLMQIGFLVLGGGALLHDDPLAMVFLRSAGAVYLAFLGIRMKTTALDRRARRQIGGGTRAMALWEGTLSSLTNPKTFLFLVVVLPQFVDPKAGPIWLQLLILGILHKLAGFVTLGSVAFAADRFGRLMERRPRLLLLQRNLCGMLMLCMGAALATRIPILP